MNEYLPIIMIIVVVAMMFDLILAVIYSSRERNSIMKMAKKIDPSVKTFSEAQYVLQKDLAKNIGVNKKDDDNKD